MHFKAGKSKKWIILLAALIALAENLEREQLHFFEEAEAYRRRESVQQSTGKSYTAGIRGVFFQRGMTEQCLFQCLLPEIGIPAGKLPESGHVFFQSRIFLPQ